MAKLNRKEIDILQDTINYVRQQRTSGGRPSRLGPTGGLTFLAQINGAADQSGNIWYYGFSQHIYNADGSTTAVAGGYSGSSLGTDFALNLAEIGNATTGLQMNGIDADTLCEGVTIQPAPDGKIVKMWFEVVADQDPPFRAFFDKDNAADGVPV